MPFFVIHEQCVEVVLPERVRVAGMRNFFARLVGWMVGRGGERAIVKATFPNLFPGGGKVTHRLPVHPDWIREV